jgi:predicted dehydrogenase
MSESIGVGVIGMGFMGSTHVSAYEAARRDGYPCKVIAVCDQDPQRMKSGTHGGGNLPGGGVEPLLASKQLRIYADVDDILRDKDVQIVSICTHTETHADLTIRALDAGKHVLVEKPLAVRSADATRVRVAAERAKTLCMPAFCMRFWPGWSWLKQRLVERTYGNVRSAVFERLASPPGWAPDFYRDPGRSGGALVDLHIHDADFVRWCFGEPTAVSSTGSLDHVTTLYRFASGPPHIVAEGGWDHTPGFPFKMRFVVAFERATVEFDSSREPPLVLATGGELNPVPLDSISGWDLEVRHFVHAVSDGRRDLIATARDAERVALLLEAEERSLRSGLTVTLSE